MNLLKDINLFKKSKNIYLIFLGIVVLLGIAIGTTYAKFPSNFITSNDIVEINLGFDVSISSIQEYDEIVVEPMKIMRFNIQLTNNSNDTVYYGMWYDMIDPNVLPSNGSIEVGWITGTTGPTSGELVGNGSTTASIAIVNNTASKIKIYIGVNSSATSTTDIEYLNGKYLISNEVSDIASRDISITYVSVDGEKTNSIPTEGMYEMIYSCQKGSTLSWNNDEKSITYEKGAAVGDKCSLMFTTYKPLLNTMPVGSYVAYEGKGGTVGSTSVACQKGGTATDSALAYNAETESPNSCLGQNAREDLDTSGYTYGYCYSGSYKFYVTGWRVAYIDSNNKPVIISAGSPECNIRTNSTANATYIKTANTKAMKYCNSDYVDGDCSCIDSDSDGYCDCTDSDSDGLCDEIENGTVDAWAVSDFDFYNMIKAISGFGKRLTEGSSSLGDNGGTLGSTLYCYIKGSYEECGYNNDLIDNGGWYWFAAIYSSSTTDGVFWNPSNRLVSNNTRTYAYGLRPVINLSSSVVVTGGTGTIDDPYTITNS